MTEIIWPSPNGVDHLTVMLPGGVPGIAQGKCSTCGRVHNIDRVPHVQQVWPWHWVPVFGAPNPCAYCGQLTP